MQQLRRHEEAVNHFQVAADLTPDAAGTSLTVYILYRHVPNSIYTI